MITVINTTVNKAPVTKISGPECLNIYNAIYLIENNTAKLFNKSNLACVEGDSSVGSGGIYQFPLLFLCRAVYIALGKTV